MLPVGIGETLRQDLAKLIMRESEDQAKTACGNMQLCAGLEAGIEGDKHAVGHRRLGRVRQRRRKEEAMRPGKDEDGGERGDGG